MGFFRQIGIGFSGYFKAISLLFTWKFFRYMFIPLLLNIIIFYFLMSVVSDFAVDAREWFKEWINLEDAEFWGSGFLRGAVSGIITGIIYFIFFISFVFFGGYLIIIIMSPLFSIISERTEHVLTDNAYSYPFDLKQLIKDIIRGIGIALRNLFLEFGIMIVVFVVGFLLAGVGSVLSAVFMFVVTSYFYGFSYMDYSNERYKRNLKESVKFMRKYKWVAIVNGSFFTLVLFISFIGVILSAFLAVLSVIAATVSMVEIKKREDAETDKVFNAEI